MVTLVLTNHQVLRLGMDESQNLSQENKCKYCSKKVLDYTQCEICQSHYHRSCSARVKIASKTGNFVCCENKEKSEVSLPITPKNSEKQENMLDMDERRLREIIKDSFKHYLKPVEEKMDKKLNEIGVSIQFMSDAFDDQKKVFESILAENKELRKENEDLKQRIVSIENKLESMEVAEKAKNMIIMGVPKQSNIDATSIVKRIINTLGMQGEDKAIVESFRLGKEGEGPILVKMQNEQAKKDIIKRIKEVKGITTKQCKFNDAEEKKIYINEDMPMCKRILFKKTRETKKTKGYKAAFYLNGTIFLKKNDSDQAIKVRSEQDLQ